MFHHVSELESVNIDVDQLHYRCCQSTDSLFKEIELLGGVVVDCGRSNDVFGYHMLTTNEKEKGSDTRRYGYLDRGSNVLGVGHLDSVSLGQRDKFFVKYSKKKKRITIKNTCLDDRLGIYTLLDYLPSVYGINLDILFCDHEEIGDSTASDFTLPEKHKGYNWLVEFDRRGTDCVSYTYNNIDAYLEPYFKLGIGSFSDICYLTDLGICGFNCGIGYYNEHMQSSHMIVQDYQEQIVNFNKFYEDTINIKIDHEEIEIPTHNNSSYFNPWKWYENKETNDRPTGRTGMKEIRAMDWLYCPYCGCDLHIPNVCSECGEISDQF